MLERKREQARHKMLMPSIVRDGKAPMERSNKPIIKKKKIVVEINDEEADRIKYLGPLQQIKEE
jgi:hypothetical protein